MNDFLKPCLIAAEQTDEKGEGTLKWDELDPKDYPNLLVIAVQNSLAKIQKELLAQLKNNLE